MDRTLPVRGQIARLSQTCHLLSRSMLLESPLLPLELIRRK